MKPAPSTFRALDRLDPRANETKAIMAWRAAIVAELGGEAALTAIQTEWLELALRTKVQSDRQERAHLSRKPPGLRGDQRITLRRSLSGLLKLLAVGDRQGSAVTGRTPSHKILPTLDDLRRRGGRKSGR